MTLPTDSAAFKDAVIADARGEDDDPAIDALIRQRAVELRDPANLARWREMLVAIVRELDVQYASRRRQEDMDKLVMATADREYQAGDLTALDHADARLTYLAQRHAHDTWRANVAKFRVGIETRLREARALSGAYDDRLRAAIAAHRDACLADDELEPTEADRTLWKELE